jgi:hypothetical protein
MVSDDHYRRHAPAVDNLLRQLMLVIEAHPLTVNFKESQRHQARTFLENLGRAWQYSQPVKPDLEQLRAISASMEPSSALPIRSVCDRLESWAME